MAQQTAVDWLIYRLLDGSLRFEETEMGFLISMENGDEIDKAKEMEKQQITQAFLEGSDFTYKKDSAELYYNETYNK